MELLGSAIRTHREAVRAFFSRKSPRAIRRIAIGTWLARAALGPPGPRDVVAAATAIAVWPVQEWFLHKYLLHLRPTTIGGVRIDPSFARAHRKHHVDPRQIDTTLLPLATIRGAGPLAAAGWLLAFGPTRAALTGIATYSTMALFYEWTHFIVHTNVKPLTAYGRRVRRNHRLHHYRHEGYWFGFTLPLVDRLFGTAPDPERIEKSATAMDLYGLEADAAAS